MTISNENRLWGFGNPNTALEGIEKFQHYINCHENIPPFKLSSAGNDVAFLDPAAYIDIGLGMIFKSTINLMTCVVARPLGMAYDLSSAVAKVFVDVQQAKNHLKSAIKAPFALVLDLAVRICAFVLGFFPLFVALGAYLVIGIYMGGELLGQGLGAGINFLGGLGTLFVNAMKS